jgi:hypothetical protein
MLIWGFTKNEERKKLFEKRDNSQSTNIFWKKIISNFILTEFLMDKRIEKSQISHVHMTQSWIQIWVKQFIHIFFSISAKLGFNKMLG